MNASLRKRLFVWLSASILVASVAAAALSFVLSYAAANALQDTQLQQIAEVLANDSLLDRPRRFVPLSNEDAETHYVIRRLGSPPTSADPNLDLFLSDSLVPGLQTLQQRSVKWRVQVARNEAGVRFAVAQRMTVRDEVARDSALLTLLPLIALLPALMMIVGVVLRQAFAPMRAMSDEVDKLGGNQLAALDERNVPLEALPLVQAVNRLMRRLSRVLEQQRRLVADAAHELRTPVATLIVQAANVERVDMPAEGKTRMVALQQGLGRMSSLIDQLLSFARVQGAAPTTAQRLDFNEVVRRAIEDTLPLAQARGIDLGLVRNDAVTIMGDSMQAYALVRNAIDNAVRYSERGGAVDVSIASEAGAVCFVVQDSGPGIAAADIERAFEPFVRVLGSDETGSGLGLAIARSAAQSLGGSILLGGRSDGRSGLRFVYAQSALG